LTVLKYERQKNRTTSAQNGLHTDVLSVGRYSIYIRYLMIKEPRAFRVGYLHWSFNEPLVNGCCATVINVSQALMCLSKYKVKRVITDVHYVID